MEIVIEIAMKPNVSDGKWMDEWKRNIENAESASFER